MSWPSVRFGFFFFLVVFCPCVPFFLSAQLFIAGLDVFLESGVL